MRYSDEILNAAQIAAKHLSTEEDKENYYTNFGRMLDALDELEKAGWKLSAPNSPVAGNIVGPYEVRVVEYPRPDHKDFAQLACELDAQHVAEGWVSRSGYPCMSVWLDEAPDTRLMIRAYSPAPKPTATEGTG